MPDHALKQNSDQSDIGLNKEKNIFHIALHFIVPLAVALLFAGPKWRGAFLVLIATMIVDIDHIVADPIYDPMRCSIGFHPFHQHAFIVGYLLLTIPSKTRWVGIGLCIHMLLDSIDCYTNLGIWTTPAF